MQEVNHPAMDYVRQEKPLLNEPKLRCGLAMQAGPAEGRLSTGGEKSREVNEPRNSECICFLPLN